MGELGGAPAIVYREQAITMKTEKVIMTTILLAFDTEGLEYFGEASTEQVEKMKMRARLNGQRKSSLYAMEAPKDSIPLAKATFERLAYKHIKAAVSSKSTAWEKIS